MSNKEFGIRLKIDGDISDILNSLKNLKTAFNGVEMPDKLTKDLTKSIDSAIQKVGEFGKRSESAINSLSDSKEIANAWKSVSKELTALQVKLEGIDAQNLFPKEVITNLEKAEAVAKKYNDALTGAKSSDSYKNKLEELNKVAELQKATEANSKKASQDALKAEATYNKEKAQWTEETNKKYAEQQQKITESSKALKDQSDKLKELLELQKKLQAEGYLTSNKTVSKTKKEAVKQLASAEADEKGSKRQVGAAKAQVTKYKNANTGKDLSQDEKYLALVKKQTEAEKAHEQILKRIKQLREQIGDTDKLNQAENIGEQINNAKELKTALENQATAAQTSGKALQDQKNALDKAEKAYIDASTDAETYKKNLEDLEQQQQDINNELKSIQTSQAENEWKELVEVIKEFTGVDLSQSAHSLEQVNAAVEQYKEGQLKNLPETLKQILANATPVGPAMERVGEGVKEAGEDIEKMTRAASEVENLKNQVLQFFSITNTIQLFKRAVTSALNTVKELDATMTEAAVVTEFDVGDMWDKLPQYSAEAQKLGVSINGMYQATTLYYQQGLKNQEAMELGIETMKMGKIAGMESAEATQAMTAALRGFNMELNETSATRVNDVYSQLAAVTAADTNQIATAMEKTASIAASANMEFESTAAFLAQIIETTQEAPETAGTALKTIIARFAEVKSLRDQGLTSGEDSEGEIIDVNKIQTALRSVGISMEGFFNGTEGLDSVFLKLSEKWGSLDFETQRYIATMAAGSRQQSRFIAMMSDYGRTTELVSEAQNSAGASQKQFEKTQESLATSLQRLENAWNEFLMGLANNDVLKFAVDTLTTVLTVINKIIDGISGGNGLIKAVTSLVGVVGALKLGKSVFEGKGLGNVLSRLTGQGSTEVIDRKTTDANGNIVEEHVVKNPQNQGMQAGQKAGQGFVTGFKNAVEKSKAGEKGVKNFFKNTFTGKQEFQMKGSLKKFDKDAFSKQLAKEEMALDENDFSQHAMDLRRLNEELADGQITTEQAAAKYQQMGGSLKNLGPTVQSTTLNLQAMGQATMGVGALLGGLSAIFEAAGWEEGAEAVSTLAAVFMGLGTVMSTLSAIAPMLGMSFTTAGIQITKAGVTSQLAWWWVFLIIAALAVFITLGVAIFKIWSNNSLENRMERAAEATENARAAAESAKEAYDSLLSEKSDYDNLQNTLDGLTKGTTEWKKALLEANNQVLQLLASYPELAKYVKVGKDGQLSIDSAGWNKIIDDQYQGAQNTQAAYAMSQQQEVKLKQEKARSNFLRDVQDAGGDADGNAADLIYQKYKDDPSFLQEGSAGMEELEAKTGMAAYQILALADSIATYDAALQANQAQMSALTNTAVSGLVSQNTRESEYGNMVIEGVSKNLGSANYDANTSKGSDSEANRFDAGMEETDFKNLAEELGIESKMTKTDTTQDLKIMYAKLAGYGDDLSKIPKEIADDSAKMAAEIAKMADSRAAAKRADTITTKIATAPKEQQAKVAALVSGNMSNLTMKDINSLSYKDYTAAGITADDLGYKTNEKGIEGLTTQQKEASLNMLLKNGAITQEDIAENTDENGNVNYNQLLKGILNSDGQISAEMMMAIDGQAMADQAKKAQEDAMKVIQFAGSEYEAMFDNSTMGVVSSVSKQIQGMSKSNAQAYLDQWNEIMEASGGDKELESYLANVDWSNMAEANEAMDYMQSKGLDQTKIENYWNAATNGAGAYVNSLSQALQLTERLQNKMLGINDVVGRLAEGKGTYEDVMKMVEAGVDISKFQLTDEGWKASDEDLAIGKAKLANHYADQARATAAQHQKEVEKAQNLTGTGITKNADGTFSIASDQATNSTSLSKHVTTSEDGTKLVAEKITGIGHAKEIGNQLGVGDRSTYKDDASYIEAVQEALNKFVDLNNDDGSTSIVLDKTTAFAELQAAQADLDAGAKEVKDSWSQWKKMLNSSDEEKQAKALNEMRGAAQRLLNTEGNLSDAFLKNAKNQELMKKAAAGNKEALNELQKEAAKDMFKSLGKDGKKALGRIQDDIDAIADADIEVGVTVTTNEDDPNQSIANKLTNMYNEAYNAAIKGGKEVAEAEAIANNLIAAEGFTAPEMVAQEVIVQGDVPPSVAAEGAGWVTGPNGEKVQGYNIRKIEGGKYEYTYTRFVPKENSGFTKTSETVGGGKKGNTGGGGGSKKYDNSHDKFYNSYEEINKLLREREKIERRYDQLLKKRAVSGKELQKNQKSQLENLKKQAAEQEKIKAGKAEEIEELMAGKSGQKFKDYVTFDKETGEINIDWDKVNALSASKGEEFDEYLSKLEGLRDQMRDAEDSLDEISDTVEEIRDQGKDEYFDLEDRIKNALIQERQDEIDSLNEINDSINDTNSRILDSLQQQIDEARQARDNQDTEDEIADKQRRLAYLKQDTSGANATEILKLQEEIDQAQEDYTDTLIDQKISDLQAQNDEAAEQRERQISILEQQLQHYEESGEVWNDVYELWNGGVDANGMLINGSRLEEILKKSESFEGLSNLGKEDWLSDLGSAIASAWTYVNGNRRAKEGDKVTFKTKDGKTVTGTADKDGNIKTKDGTVYKNVYQDETGEWHSTENFKTKKEENKEEGKKQEDKWKYDYPKPSTGSKQLYKGDTGKEVKGLQQALNDLGYRAGEVDGIFGKNTLAAVKKFQTDAKSWYPDIGKANGYVGPKTREAFRLKGYETGGLADFTGPAWLDGTKSRPEYILNADQTKAFFSLVDVLESLGKGETKTTENSGDNTFDIDINVESIGSDYDVEQMAATIKRLINEDARYRNNNAINLMR